jgi:hypothetical protein
VNGQWPIYDTGHDNNVVSLYGPYGNDETQGSPIATNHYAMGNTQAQAIHPVCYDGSDPVGGTCNDPAHPTPYAIFLLVGFSNWDIEIGGGAMGGLGAVPLVERRAAEQEPAPLL